MTFAKWQAAAQEALGIPDMCCVRLVFQRKKWREGMDPEVFALYIVRFIERRREEVSRFASSEPTEAQSNFMEWLRK